MMTLKRTNNYKLQECLYGFSIFDPDGKKYCKEISELCPNQKITNTCSPKDDLKANNSEPQVDSQIKIAASDILFCNCCHIQFLDRNEQTNHYKCDWHRYNIYRKIKNFPPISEDDFEKVAGEVSSISGSDSDCSDNEDSHVQQLHETESLNDQDNNVFNHPKLFFKNSSGEVVSIYRCLIYQKKFPIDDKKEVERLISELPEKSKWIILMVSSGHFAGAILHGKEVLEHKTFHRYTIRAKRGTAQSNRDNQGSAPRSAGASLRRYHETALIQDVQELLISWSEHIKSCHYIFLRVPVANKIMLFGGKNPALKKDDPRLRIIPLTTRRPTFNEIQKVHQILSSVEYHGKDVEMNNCFPLMSQKTLQTEQVSIARAEKFSGNVNLENTEIRVSEFFNVDEQKESPEQSKIISKKNKKTSKIIQNSPEIRNSPKKTDTLSHQNSTDDSMTLQRNSIYTACKCGDVLALKNSFDFFHKLENTMADLVCVESVSQSMTSISIESAGTNAAACGNGESLTSEHIQVTRSHSQLADFLNTPVVESGTTFLHLASKEGHPDIITALLDEGADPVIRDKSGKTPYCLGNTQTRNAFRRFMANYPERYDYVKAQIPSALTTEMEKEKKIKAAEKRKIKKKALSEKNKEKKAAEAIISEEKKEKERFLALSDREKRALAAERRLLQQNAEQGTTVVALSRCYQCATDITGKVPFEYADFKFCTTKCLREHRTKSSV